MGKNDDELRRATDKLVKAGDKAIASIIAFRKAWRESVRKRPR